MDTVANKRAIGTYVLKEDIFLATPPPHPSEAPVTNLNPLSTAPQPTVAGTKLSLVSLKYRSSPHPYRSQTFSPGKENQESDSRTSAETDDQSSLGKAASGSSASKNGDTVIPMHPEKFGGGNSSLSAATGKDAAKRKKPKNNIAKNNSSFVSRIIPHENLAKRLAERNDEDLFVFANINRAFNWLDMDSTNKVQEFYLTINFKNRRLISYVFYSKNPCQRSFSPRHIQFAMMSTSSPGVPVI
jgi:hypothetical protein